jgi:hypothetical protein
MEQFIVYGVTFLYFVAMIIGLIVFTKYMLTLI